MRKGFAVVNVATREVIVWHAERREAETACASFNDFADRVGSAQYHEVLNADEVAVAFVALLTLLVGVVLITHYKRLADEAEVRVNAGSGQTEPGVGAGPQKQPDEPKPPPVTPQERIARAREMDDWAEVETLARKYLGRKPGNAEMRNHLVDALFEQRKLLEVVDYLERLPKSQREVRDCENLIGAYIRLPNLESIETANRRVIETVEQYGNILSLRRHQVRYYEKTGQGEARERALQLLCSKWQSDPDVRELCRDSKAKTAGGKATTE